MKLTASELGVLFLLLFGLFHWLGIFANTRAILAFLGIVILAVGLLLLVALLTYHTGDPSLFSSVADPAARPRNWAGRVGASFAEGAFQFFGFSALVLPAAILALGAVALEHAVRRVVNQRLVLVLIV